MSRLTILWDNNCITADASAQETLLSVLQRSGAPIFAPCGGNGRCGKCAVTVTRDEESTSCLACNTPAGASSAGTLATQSGGAIAVDGAAVTAHAARAGYGAAVDLGTTTVAVRLFDLSSGALLGTASAWNAQGSYGADVISRAQHIMTHAQGLETLSGVIRNQVFSMARQLCAENNVDFSALRGMTVAGNTIMQHIFAGLNPSSIAVAPYTPVTLFEDNAAQRFDEQPHISVTFVPCVAGYVGGDITAGMLATDVSAHKGVALFLDIGTNGEMALCDNGRILCCSVASGPAFEGAEITCGMPSHAGAISHVRWDAAQLQLQVVGDCAPVGICGSGLIDLLAVLLDTETLDESGWLPPADEAPDEMSPYLSEDAQGNGLLQLADGVIFTAGDVRKLQLAKAAVAAGIDILLQQAGRMPEEIDTLYIAGGFGGNLNAVSAARIGMIPTTLAQRVVSVGNSSLSGASQLLLQPAAHARLKAQRPQCTYCELSGNQAFSDAFVEHMTFDA